MNSRRLLTADHFQTDGILHSIHKQIRMRAEFSALDQIEPRNSNTVSNT